MLPDNFYDKVEEGSIILKKPKSFQFCREGLVIDGENEPLKTDLVIFATGYRGDEKLKSMFHSPTFQNYIMGSPTSTVPLYRYLISTSWTSNFAIPCERNNIFHFIT